MAGYLVKRHFVRRVAEILVKRLFNFSQVHPQFVHHAAHRLSIADSAIQLFHPGFQWLRRATFAHLIQPAGKPLAAGCHRRVGRVEIFVGRFKVQNSSRNLHCNWRTGGFARPDRRVHCTNHGTRQIGVFRMQFQHGFSDCRKLLLRRLHAIGVSARQR